MKKLIVLLSSIILYTNPALANQQCFIAKENSKILKIEGDCSTRYSPQSTFKIALSLIGFDSGILKNENKPSWSLPQGINPSMNICKSDHNPHSWMRDSCLWYSNILTTKLGIQKFQDYVTKFSYGNMDINNNLTNAWISSSLKISPEEQTVFLQKIIDQKLHVSKASYNKTKNIMFIQEIAGGWKLYGKTGNGRQSNQYGNTMDLQHGWFVGYIEKDNRKIVFAGHMIDNETQKTFASFRIKNEVLIKLWHLINEIEK